MIQAPPRPFFVHVSGVELVAKPPDAADEIAALLPRFVECLPDELGQCVEARAVRDLLAGPLPPDLVFEVRADSCPTPTRIDQTIHAHVRADLGAKMGPSDSTPAGLTFFPAVVEVGMDVRGVRYLTTDARLGTGCAFEALAGYPDARELLRRALWAAFSDVSPALQPVFRAMLAVQRLRTIARDKARGVIRIHQQEIDAARAYLSDAPSHGDICSLSEALAPGPVNAGGWSFSGTGPIPTMG